MVLIKNHIEHSPHDGTWPIDRARPAPFQIVVICVVLLLCSMYCLCVNVYCTTATGCQQIYHKFDVRKSVHHHIIQTNQPTRCNSFTSLLLDVYVWLNIFLAPLHPSSRAQNCTRSLRFYRWSVAVGALLVLPDHNQQRSNCHTPMVKPEALSAVVHS